jgi:hypothetical protein
MCLQVLPLPSSCWDNLFVLRAFGRWSHLDLPVAWVPYLTDMDCDGRLKYPEFKRLVQYTGGKLPGEQWQALCATIDAGAPDTIGSTW